MSIFILASQISYKYAQELQPDTSFGKPITPEKTKILKDKLSQLATYITQLPDFKQAEQIFANDDLFDSLKASLDLYSSAVEGQNLKENFQFFVKVINKLNKIREDLPKQKINKRLMYALDTMLKRVQDYIWEHTKALIHLHDLRGLDLTDQMLGSAMTLKQRITPTWAYGPMRNPAKKLLQHPHPSKDLDLLMKRLEKEMEDEAKIQKENK